MTENVRSEALKKDLKYLNLLSKSFPTIAEASTEIINLQAILHLPKGTEHFLADIHGESEAFLHVLKNASGSIKRKVNQIFGQTLRESEKRELCSLIYYPREKLEQIKLKEDNLEEWYTVVLNQLIMVCEVVCSKYTRSKVQKALPQKYNYIIRELLHESTVNPNKSAYISVIIDSIISTQQAEEFIVAICESIQHLVIDHLHIVGDIYDRGPGAHIIMDRLCEYKNWDIQWGNHDILWMGAAVGNKACMANALRIALRYGNLASIEEGYAINLMPLARFAMETYGTDQGEVFTPKLTTADQAYDEKSVELISQMQKAISIIQFKLEAEIINRHPEYEMSDRNLLHCIDRTKGTIVLPNGKEYTMKDTFFPTIDPEHPYQLTEAEAEVVERLTNSFVHSEKLRKHLLFLYSHGSLYLSINKNLLYHAAIPLDEKGDFKEVLLQGELYKGKALMEKIDQLVRLAYFGDDDSEDKSYANDYIWYLWCGKDSPLFDKSAMTTFERYFIAEKETHHEEKGFYFKYRNEQKSCERILEEFGLSGTDTHIINGHVPVKASRGENPLRAGGKLLVIDGGFSRAYQPSTGIAGYTLIFNSHGLELVQHEPFYSSKQAVDKGLDINSSTVVRDFQSQRVLVKDTDNGKNLASQVSDLKELLEAYRLGLIKEAK